MADASMTFAHQTFAKRAASKTDGNCPPFAARLHFTGRSGFQADAQIMQTTGAGKPGIQSCIQNAFALSKHFPCVSERETLEKILRCDACPRREQTMKVMLAQTMCRASVVRLGWSAWLSSRYRM